MRTIFVTGGAGFIGSNFVKYWFNKYPDDQIIVLDALTYAGNPQNFPERIKESKRFEFWYGNVTNDELVNDLVSKSGIVVHFAAESHVARSIFDNKAFYLTDVIGTQVVANAVLKNYRTVERFIHISTSEVYGTALTNPMTEEHPLNPMSPYASAKAGADRLVYSYWTTYDVPAVIVRPFNQYGPRQHLEKVIPRFVTSALKNEPLTIHGDGSARRDWLHVDDTCERLDLIVNASLEKIRGEVFNIGSGYDLDVLSIARIILKATGRSDNLITFIGDRLGQVQHHISSTEKGEQTLGIRPGRPFELGLQETIKWYDENHDWWKPLEWMKEVKIKTKSGKVERH
ncbi:MAG: epimerase [Desulfobulbaceae bacterium S5133MH15]|nr:MAG: epimerase [Desulfobulbaceae bacterium S5133MH15]OEU84359.1 MAG: epimerase [Desulfobulbaceae bacterium C00003063]